MRKTVIRDWLSVSDPGPYIKSDNSSDFYYLGGHFLAGNEGPDDAVLQICSDPLNALSVDCLDGIHCYVLND